MARPREFDETEVLDAAIECFWSRGFEATSVRELAERMGLTAASLYNAFGDKRALFRRALDHYVERGLGERLRRLAALPPRAAIEAFFAEAIERSLSDPRRKGCMLVNTALELAPHDAEIQAAVAAVLARTEAFFRHCVEAGQDAGAITRAQAPDDLARLLVGVHIGLRVLARTRPERELLEGTVRPALALLEPHPTHSPRTNR